MKVERVNINLDYRPLILFESGHPIFKIGQSLDDIDSTLSYRVDPNGTYQDFFPLIKDYLSTDDDLSTHRIGEHSYINGIVYFSADESEKRIFNVSAHWTFAVYDEDVVQKMESWVTTNIFPTLVELFQLEDGWTYEQRSPNQLELLKLKKDSNFWNLEYTVELK